MKLRKYAIRALAILGVLVIILFGGATAYVAWLPSGRLSLPSSLVAYDDQPIENNHISADFYLLKDSFEAQRFRSFCGVASSVIAVNSLKRSKIDQLDYFSQELTPSFLSTYFRGMTLDQFAKGIESFGFETEVYFADTITIEKFKQHLVQNLQNTSDLIIANYSRQSLDQAGSGHISPIGAYDPVKNSILVMDVASHKYPFTWVKVEDFYNSMKTIDSSSGKWRGYVLISNERENHGS